MNFSFSKKKNFSITVSWLARKHDYKRARKPVSDRKPRQAYSARQLDRLEKEFQVNWVASPLDFIIGEVNWVFTIFRNKDSR